MASAGTRTAAAAPAGPAAFDPEKFLPAVPGEIDVVQSYDAAEAAPMNGIHPDKPWLALGPGPVPLADAQPQWGWSLQGIADGPRNVIAARERAGWRDAAIADDLAPGVLTFPAKADKTEPDQHHRLIRPLSRGRRESVQQSETNQISALWSSPINALPAISKFASPSHAE